MFCKQAAYVAAQFIATTVCNENHKLILSILPGKLDAPVAELFVFTGSRLWALRLQNNGNDSLWRKMKWKKPNPHYAEIFAFVACYEQIAWKKYINMSQWVNSVFTSPLNML